MTRRYPTREATLATMAEDDESAGGSAQADPQGEPPEVEQADAPRAPVAPELATVQERLFELFEQATADQREHLVSLLDDVNRAVEGPIEGAPNAPRGQPNVQYFVRKAGM